MDVDVDVEESDFSTEIFVGEHEELLKADQNDTVQ